MDKGYKNILYIDIAKREYEFKSHQDLWAYIGGIGIAYKLLLDNIDLNPVILTTGPLAGLFPYASKSLILYINNYKVIEGYGGGTVHSLLNLARIDGIVFIGDTTDNVRINISGREVVFSVYEKNLLESKNTDFYLSSNLVLSENYFSYGVDKMQGIQLNAKISLSIDTTESTELKEYYDYEKLYHFLLKEFKKLTVEPRNNPSCYGCPMGCEFSASGENDLNIAVLPRTLISCGYAESIYKHIPLVYACLNTLGHRYNHSDLENISDIVGIKKAKVNQILEDIKKHSTS